jgi:hypothetical protein
LTDLLERSKKHLSKEQEIQLTKWLIKFQGTFSVDDMDIAHFTDIPYGYR